MQLIFVHVPKTAGWALHEALETVFGARNSLHINDGDKLHRLRGSSAKELARYDYISGHFDFHGIADKCRADAVFISVLRDPISRILSEYNYMFSSAEHPYHATIRAQPLSDYIYGSENHFRGYMCRQLTGFLDAESSLAELRARYGLVGTKASLPAFVERLSQVIGAPLAVTQTNVTPGQGRLDLDSALCTKLLDITYEDRKLLDAISAMPNGVFEKRAPRDKALPKKIGERVWEKYLPLGEGVYRVG